MNSGIYRIINVVNGKFYIGQTLDLRARKISHFVCLRGNRHHNPRLQSSYNKHGEESFVFEVLEETEPINLAERERFWVKKLEAIKFGYNIKEGGMLGGKPGKIFEWKNLLTKEEVNLSAPDLAKREGVCVRNFYSIIYKKRKTAYGWTLKSNTEVTKVKSSKKVFLSIKNHETGEVYENLSVKEAVKITGRGMFSILALACGKHKRSGNWVLINYDPSLFKKKKPFKRSDHFKEAVSRWKLTIFDSLEGKVYNEYRTGKLMELTGIPPKRWMELVSGRKKILRKRYSLISAFKIEKVASQAP